MRSNAVARRYATALFAAANAQQQAEAVSADLLALVAALKGSREFAGIWHHLQLTADQKRETLHPVLKSLLQSEQTRNLVSLLFDKGREGQIEAISEDFHATLRQSRQEVLAEVTTTRDLSADEEAKITALVRRLTGCRTVTLAKQVDQRIMGGVIVRVGDRVYDGSLARRLDNLRRQLKQAQVKQAGVSS